jgi:hypothetical protein
VPTSITLNVLHEVIQAAMGWLDYHLWEFTFTRSTCVGCLRRARRLWTTSTSSATTGCTA